MKKIELPFDPRADYDEEIEITKSDFLRIYIGTNGAMEITVHTSAGEKTEISFDEEGSLASLVRDFE